PERAVLRRGPRPAPRGRLRGSGGHRPSPGAGPQLALAAAQARPPPAALEPPLGGAAHARPAGGRRSGAALFARSHFRRPAQTLIRARRLLSGGGVLGPPGPSLVRRRRP